MPLRTSPMPQAQEIAVHDYQGFGSLSIGAHEDIDSVHQKATFMIEHGALGAAAASCYDGDLEAAELALQDYYEGDYESERHYAWHLFDKPYLHRIPEHIQAYIDYDQFKRDIFMSDYFAIELAGKSHIFSHQ